MALPAVMQFKIAVLADDLTSAGDGAGPFRALGIPANIFLGAIEGDLPVGVSAVDANTRSQDVGAAVSETVRCIQQIKHADVLFKTIDSTIRGHVVAEVEAALAGSGRSTAVIAPAFPTEGRTTLDGIQLVDGVPVAETHFGLDAGNPAKESDIKKLFPQAGLITAASRWDHRVGEERILIADACSDADLDRLVNHPESPSDVLWVGSPGLAAAVARKCATSWTAQPAPEAAASTRVLIVVGSLHPSSREQLDVLVGQLPAHSQDPAADGAESQAGPVERIAKELSCLRFKVTSCTVSYPYVLKWKVLNRGAEAERRNNIRGQIIESSHPNARHERTSFRGEHVVECFVVKDGVVVARDRIDVPIGNTSTT